MLTGTRLIRWEFIENISEYWTRDVLAGGFRSDPSDRIDPGIEQAFCICNRHTRKIWLFQIGLHWLRELFQGIRAGDRRCKIALIGGQVSFLIVLYGRQDRRNVLDCQRPFRKSLVFGVGTKCCRV